MLSEINSEAFNLPIAVSGWVLAAASTDLARLLRLLGSLCLAACFCFLQGALRRRWQIGQSALWRFCICGISRQGFFAIVFHGCHLHR